MTFMQFAVASRIFSSLTRLDAKLHVSNTFRHCARGPTTKCSRSSEHSAYFHEIFILVIKCENAFYFSLADLFEVFIETLASTCMYRRAFLKNLRFLEQIESLSSLNNLNR